MTETNTDCWMLKSELDRLMEELRARGYQVLGPRVDQSAIVYGEVTSLRDLPQGYGDSQAAGKYRITRAAHDNYFEFNVGPQSWKQFLFPPRVTLTSSQRQADGWHFRSGDDLSQPPPKLAFLGVRACELAAIAVQDRIFLEGPYVDPIYQQRRQSLIVIAVNCTVAAATCFCTSMGTGPRCHSSHGSFDLALTELDDGFLIEVGSAVGGDLLAALHTRPADAAVRKQAHARQQRAEEQITKRFDTDGVRELLLNNLDHPHWDDVANRCLSCTNCTMVCPTCFCSSVSEVSDLTGDKVDRERHWDSCFNIDFGYMAGGVVRQERRSRFRQWLTHKLASWHDQFDSSGCVGCGRCIAWCPVGIDLTEEVAALRAEPASNRTLPIVTAEPASVCVLKD